MSALPTVVLYQPPTKPWGMPNMSPFCIKLECYLRMAKIPFESRDVEMRKAPKGKIPYAAVGGALMGDSQLIVERLEALRGPDALDAWLSPEQRAVGRAARRMLEEGTYFATAYLRWVHDDGWKTLVPEFKKLLPAPLAFALPLVRSQMKKTLWRQGTGRHTDAEIQAMARADLEAVATLLGSKPYLMGDWPSTMDATLFAFLESIGRFPVDSDVTRFVKAQSNLTEYRDRIRKQFWSVS